MRIDGSQPRSFLSLRFADFVFCGTFDMLSKTFLMFVRKGAHLVRRGDIWCAVSQH